MMLLTDYGLEDDNEEEPRKASEEIHTLHHLSLCATQGSSGIAAIRFNGIINGMDVQVLLDRGSSDNYVHPRVVQQLQLPSEVVPTFRSWWGLVN